MRIPKEPQMISATQFRELREQSELKTHLQRLRSVEHAAEQEAERVRDAISQRMTDADWQGILAKMQIVAANGASRYQIVRFPSAACTDLGRQINSGQRSGTWGSTLQGRARDAYRFWDRDLRQAGFTLSAEVLEFPHGKPGDVGITVVWG